MWIFGRHRHLAENELSDYVGGRLSAHQAGRLEHSLDECLSCRQDLESLQVTRSLLRELPAHVPPRSFVFATAPATVPSAPVNGPIPSRGWAFRPPGWAYAGAASVVGLAVAVFVFSSDVSQWLPGDTREISATELMTDAPASLAAQPEAMTAIQERQESVPPPRAPAPAAQAIPMEQPAVEAALAAPAAEMSVEPTPAPEAAFFAQELYEEPIQDAVISAAPSETSIEQASPAIPTAEAMSMRQTEEPTDAPVEASQKDTSSEALPAPTTEIVLAKAEAPPQQESGAPPPVVDQPTDPVAGQEFPAPTPMISNPAIQDSSAALEEAKVPAGGQRIVIGPSSAGLPESAPTEEPQRLDSQGILSAVTEPASQDTASPVSPMQKPTAIPSISPEIENVEPEAALAESPDLSASVLGQEVLQPAPGVAAPPESMAPTISEESLASVTPQGGSEQQGPDAPEVAGVKDPVVPQVGAELSSTEERLPAEAEPQGRAGTDKGQTPQPSAGGQDADVPGFGIRYDILLAIAGTVAILILLLGLFGIYRFWVARHAGSRAGTNGAVDPSLIVNRPKLGNGGG